MIQHKTKKTISLNELSTNMTIQNSLFENVALWLINSSTQHVHLVGSSNLIETTSNAMITSKDFQRELSRQGASLESITEKLNLKHQAANSFFEVFGVKWVF